MIDPHTIRTQLGLISTTMAEDKFKAGDRVRVYGWARSDDEPEWAICTFNGTVTHVAGNMLTVKSDGEGLSVCVHHKQCRRLVKKERRRVWVEYEDDRVIKTYTYSPPKMDSFGNEVKVVEFIEVKPKRGGDV